MQIVLSETEVWRLVESHPRIKQLAATIGRKNRSVIAFPSVDKDLKPNGDVVIEFTEETTAKE